MGTEPKMAVSITIAKMNPEEMKKEGGEEPKAEGHRFLKGAVAAVFAATSAGVVANAATTAPIATGL